MKPITKRIAFVLILFGLILIPLFPQAKEIEEQNVRSAVETWVRYVTADARPDAIIEKMEPYQVEGKTVAYIAHLGGGGFCLCGADDLVLPVYFYCPEGTYDPENQSHRYILWEIETRLKTLQEGLQKNDPNLQPYQEVLSERATFWQELTADRIPTRVETEYTLAEPIQMELNLTTRWDQESPYNNFCPMGDQSCTVCPDGWPPSSRTVVGCVATATAQIMKYWNWPSSGTGSKSYSWNGDQSCGGSTPSQVLSATFSDPYDWQNMPDYCGWGCTQAQKDALAELCYEVGVALKMDYGVCGSGAYSEDIDNALMYFLYYDADHDSDWNKDEITKDIQWLRPVVLCGRNAEGEGHCWVVFGYDKGTDPNRQFKMNMGWGGDYSSPPYGWYSLDNVPKGLIHDHRRVTDIAPLMVKFVGVGDAGDGGPYHPYKNIEEAMAKAPNGATLIFKAGSDNTFSAGTLVINRPLTLKGKDVTIRKQ